MSGKNGHGIRQAEKILPDGGHERRHTASGKIGAPDGTMEKRVSREDDALLRFIEGDPARCMPRGIDHGKVQSAGLDRVSPFHPVLRILYEYVVGEFIG